VRIFRTAYLVFFLINLGGVDEKRKKKSGIVLEKEIEK